MKKILIAIAAALLAVTVLVSSAQTEKGHDPAQRIQHRLAHLTQELGLSSAQQQQATTIFTNAMASQKSIHDQMRAAHESLKAAVQKNDSTAIDQASSTIGSLTAQMTSAHAKAQAAFYQILTPDQQSKLNQMDGHHHGHHMGHPGGPGGPGGEGDDD
jgi:Spy/CpxP family protein refolding chaperone